MEEEQNNQQESIKLDNSEQQVPLKDLATQEINNSTPESNEPSNKVPPTYVSNNRYGSMKESQTNNQKHGKSSLNVYNKVGLNKYNLTKVDLVRNHNSYRELPPVSYCLNTKKNNISNKLLSNTLNNENINNKNTINNSESWDSSKMDSNLHNKITSNKFICKVYIENYPSNNEILTILEGFISELGLKPEYYLSMKDGQMVITFKNPDIGFEFAKKLNLVKVRNSCFKKTIVNVNLDVIKNTDNYIKNIYRLPLYQRDLLHSNSTKSYKPTYMYSAQERKVISQKQMINRERANQRFQKIYNDNTNYFKQREINIRSKLLDELRKKPPSINETINASSPFLDRYEEEKKILRKEKLGWIAPTNFNKYISKATYNKNKFDVDFIHKPTNDKCTCWKLRGTAKEKWIVGNRFYV